MDDVTVVVELVAPPIAVELETPETLTVIPGLPGPPGSQSGRYAVVSVDGDIPLNQVFTIANPTADCTLTLPSIDDVVQTPFTVVYHIKNISSHLLTILPDGTDLIEFEESAEIKFEGDSLALLATPLGWLKI